MVPGTPPRKKRRVDNIGVPAPEDAMPSQGRLIADRYRLASKLGEGAMGRVWSGTDELLRRAVAIKEVYLPPGLPEDEAAEIRERALREARAIAVVTHPNVVTLYDVAREKGEPFVVMELVPSQSLATIIGEHGALNDTQIARVADGVAAGLEAAHRNGIIHRDVKPGNVLIGNDDQVKLSDFGISRNIAESTITRTGIMLGTPAFVAPEIASGDPVTAAVDLWGLGATLFAASEGHPPYNASDDPLATITSVVQDPVPIPSRGGALGELISELMVKDPARRVPPHEMRRRIQHLLPEPGAGPFDMLLDPDTPTVRVRRPARAAQTYNEQPPENEAPPLAADPGPLPFIPQDLPPLPTRSRVLPSIALGTAAVVLFAAAVVGGFVGIRMAAGQPLLPQPNPVSQSSPHTIIQTIHNAQHTSASGEGKFRIAVPQEWRIFHDERDDLTNSMSVFFVSADGRSQITVQRFGDFYPDGYTSQDYVEAHQRLISNSNDRYQRQGLRTEGNVDPYSSESDQNLTARIETVGVPPMPHRSVTRDLAEQIMPRNGDLWIVRATVEVDAQHGESVQPSKSLLSGVVATFSPEPN